MAVKVLVHTFLSQRIMLIVEVFLSFPYYFLLYKAKAVAQSRCVPMDVDSIPAPAIRPVGMGWIPAFHQAECLPLLRFQ